MERAPGAAIGAPGPRPTALEPPRLARSVEARKRRFSSLTLRILAPNVLALAILVGGVFYLDQYRGALIDAKISSLQTQAEVVAGAVAESALSGPPESRAVDDRAAGRIISRLIVPTGTRARLFDRDGRLIADSRQLVAAGREVQLKYLAPSERGDMATALLSELYDWVLPRLPSRGSFPIYRERDGQRAGDYGESAGALAGEIGGAVRQDEEGGLILSVAAPVKELHRVLGALMLTADGRDIAENVRRVRIAVLEVFAVTLVVTVLLSMFLAGTIARPVRRLAFAADQVRRWRGRRVTIPNFGHRKDEIGDLSTALGGMTEALYARLDAIDAFAADVAHELKNPLSSLRSAVETLSLDPTPAQRERLFQIIKQDVDRLDRLISDISNASRIDAEMSRDEAESFDLVDLLAVLVEVHRARHGETGPELRLELAVPGPLVIEGLSSRMAQVFENLLTNAYSFSPPGGVVRLTLARDGAQAVLMVDDEGPGVPDDGADRIFERFYSARPAGERFGRHSGLGLSISRQIVEAHGGRIDVGNRRDEAGLVLGARFVVRLPI